MSDECTTCDWLENRILHQKRLAVRHGSKVVNASASDRLVLVTDYNFALRLHKGFYHHPATATGRLYRMDQP